MLGILSMSLHFLRHPLLWALAGEAWGSRYDCHFLGCLQFSREEMQTNETLILRTQSWAWLSKYSDLIFQDSYSGSQVCMKVNHPGSACRSFLRFADCLSFSRARVVYPARYKGVSAIEQGKFGENSSSSTKHWLSLASRDRVCSNRIGLHRSTGL